MKAILLAAGRGERLRPLTDTLPKCLIPIAGRPLLDYWLESCERHGFNDILVNTHYLPEQVESFLKASKRALRIRTVREDRLLGTAGTLRANWEFVAGEPLFLYAHADNFTNLDLGAFRRDFAAGRRSDTALGMALFRTPTPRTCGIVTLDARRHVVTFDEKPQQPRGNLASGAVYLGTPALAPLLDLGNPQPREMDFSTEVVPRLVGRIFGHEIAGFLADIGTPEQYQKWKRGACGEGAVPATEYAIGYRSLLTRALEQAEASGPDGALSYGAGIAAAVQMIRETWNRGGKLMFVGNGASAAIASHQATDFMRGVGMRALAFNDGALLTCLGNDYGYERTFEVPVGLHADPQDLLVCISSSGASANILRAAEKAREIGCRLLTLSGFAANNPLRALGDVRFYVPSDSYGRVEVAHLAILHCICDFFANR